MASYTSDVEMFLQALDKNKKGELLKKLKEYEASISAPLKALGQSITVLKVQILIGDVFALPVDGMSDYFQLMNLSARQYFVPF